MNILSQDKTQVIDNNVVWILTIDYRNCTKKKKRMGLKDKVEDDE